MKAGVGSLKNLKREEVEVASKIKKLDFSRLSAAHKEKLRRQLFGGFRPPAGNELNDDELRLVAGGIEAEATVQETRE
jgi:hypothetical protein